jgi:type VI secretion system secreted protein VgrG
MPCSKYTLTNTGTTAVNFNYRRCDDNMWLYQVNLDPNETKNIWFIDGTFNIAEYFGPIVEITNDGGFPPNPTPTPSITPTLTPTITETPTNTPANTETPTNTPTVTETPTNTPTPTVTETPTNTPTPSITPTSTVTETPTNTPTSTVTETPTNTPTETPTNTPTPSSTSGGFSIFNVTVSQVGPDVVWSGSGSFNLTALSLNTSGPNQSGFSAGPAIWVIGPSASTQRYAGTSLTGYSTTFGSNLVVPTPISSGSTFGVVSGGVTSRQIAVPSGYTSNTVISGTATYPGATIASMGLTHGTYIWAWGSGSNSSSIVMVIEGPQVTPTPTPTNTPTETPTNTPTETPTPTPTSAIVEQLIDPILVGTDEYLSVGNDEYLMFVNP